MAAAVVAWATGVSSVLLKAPWWTSLTLACIFGVAYLFLKVPRTKPHTITNEDELEAKSEDTALAFDGEFRERIAKHIHVRESIWLLKEPARKIKRLWPGADFLDRPANRDLWIKPRDRPPGYSDIDDRGWLDDAIRWNEQFSRSPVVVGVDPGLLKSLDFDEIMDLCDRYERQQCGMMVPISSAPPSAPHVGISKFGMKNGRYGAFVENYRSTAAFEIRITPVRVGRYRFSFGTTVNTLTKDNGPQFIECSVKEPPITSWNGLTLFDALGERFKCIDDGFVPLNLYVTYHDSQNLRYEARHEIERHATDSENSFTSVYLRAVDLRH
jgi:hypothetical protein